MNVCRLKISIATNHGFDPLYYLFIYRIVIMVSASINICNLTLKTNLCLAVYILLFRVNINYIRTIHITMTFT